MNYAGVDLHKDSATFSVRDESGRVILSRACSTRQKDLSAMFLSLPRPFELGVEATYNYYYFVDMAAEYAIRVRLGHPLYIKAFARRHKKTDKIDAELISWLLCKRIFPDVHIASRPAREAKEKIRLYMSLVGERTRAIARTRAFCDRNGMPVKEGVGLTTLKGVSGVMMMKWDEKQRGVVEAYLKQIEFLTREINKMRSQMKKAVDADEDMRRIATIPGMDVVGAFIVRAEIDDVSRFKNSARFVAYCGLAPKTVSSAGKRIRAGLMQNASHRLKWIFIQNAAVYARGDTRAGQRWLEKTKKTNATKARLDAARRLCKITYTILKEKRRWLKAVHCAKAAQRAPLSKESQGRPTDSASPCTV
jgi:transposase